MRKYTEAVGVLLNDGWHVIVPESFSSTFLGEEKLPVVSWREALNNIEHEVNAPWASVFAWRFPV